MFCFNPQIIKMSTWFNSCTCWMISFLLRYFIRFILETLSNNGMFGRNFYMTTDGFILTWSVRFDDVTVIPVGRMELNCLSNLVRIGGPYPASHAGDAHHHRQMSVGSASSSATNLLGGKAHYIFFEKSNSLDRASIACNIAKWSIFTWTCALF